MNKLSDKKNYQQIPSNHELHGFLHRVKLRKLKQCDFAKTLCDSVVNKESDPNFIKMKHLIIFIILPIVSLDGYCQELKLSETIINIAEELASEESDPRQ